MSINNDAPFVQHETAGSADPRPYPVSFCKGPITNVGHPLSDGQPTVEHIDLAHLVDDIRSGRWAEFAEQIRKLAAYKDERVPNGKRSQRAIDYDKAKKGMAYWLPAGHFSPGHRHAPDCPQSPTSEHGRSFPECVAAEGRYPFTALSGLRFLEIDHLNDPDDLKRVRARIEIHPSVVSCWKSVGGHGLHVTVLIDPPPATNREAHVAFEVASLDTEIADTGDAKVKNLARIAIVSHDPEAYFNPNARPLVLEMPNDGQECQKSAGSEDAGAHQSAGEAPAHEFGCHTPYSYTDLAQLEAIARVMVRGGLDYNDWIGLMGAMKSAGFTASDLESISSEGGDRYTPGEIDRKWAHLLSSDNPAKVVNGMAKRLGIADRIRNRRDTRDPTNKSHSHSDASDPAPGKFTVWQSGPEGLRAALNNLRIEVRFNSRETKIDIREGNESPLAHTIATWHSLGRRPDGWFPVAGSRKKALFAEIAKRVKTLDKRSSDENPKFRPFNVRKEDQSTYLEILAATRGEDPFIEWLESLPPLAGEPPPIDDSHVFVRMWTDNFETQHNAEYLHHATQLMLLPAIGRSYKPGAAAKTITVIVGPEEIGKSLLIALLFTPEWRERWFTDTATVRDRDKQLVELTRGVVLCEFGEMAGINAVDADQLKRNRSSNIDKGIRLTYREDEEDFPRTWHAVGTANPTGHVLPEGDENSRYWPVSIRSTDRGAAAFMKIGKWFNEHRVDLWATALAEYRAHGRGPRAWATPETLREPARVERERHAGHNDNLEDIVAHLEGWITQQPDPQAGFTLAEMLCSEASGIYGVGISETARLLVGHDKMFSIALGKALAGCGWEKRQARGRDGGKNTKRWFPPGATATSEPPPTSKDDSNF